MTSAAAFPDGSSEQSGTVSVRSRGRDTVGICGGQMTSRDEMIATTQKNTET